MQLDYSPLNEKTPVSIQSDLTDIPIFSNTLGALVLTLIIVMVTGILIVPVLLSPIIFILIRNYIAKSGYSAIRLSNFAVKNGFKYKWGMKNESNFVQINYDGVIGSNNSQISASNLISGTYKDFRFQLFNPFTRGYYTIMEIELKNKYPHIVLDSKSNNPFFSNIGVFFGEDSRIKLEGDFDNFFKVYAKASPVDTLRILSPDMMQLMIDSGHKYDIEIFEDKLHLISNYKFSNELDVKYFFNLADTLLDKLDRRKSTVNATFDYKSRVK